MQRFINIRLRGADRNCAGDRLRLRRGHIAGVLRLVDAVRAEKLGVRRRERRATRGADGGGHAESQIQFSSEV